MAFQDIPLEVKVKAVIDMMKGQGATEIARRYKVGRRTLYEWIEQAKEGIRESLNLEKRGPKFKKPRVDPDLRKIEKLNELLEKREIQIRELEGLLGQYQKEEKEKEPRPKECKKCGCQKIYKNGTYSAKPKRFFDILRSREQKEIIVQQFICAHCQEPVHLEKKSAFFGGQVDRELRRAIGILRRDGQCSLRNIQIILRKIFRVKLSLGFICQELKRASQEAKKINERMRGLVDLVHCVADEVWIKVVKISKKWTYGFLLASPKSLFIYALDYLTHRDEVTMGLKVMEYQQKGFYPRIFTSDLLKIYRCIAGYFKGCLHQLCTNHGIKVMYKILKDLPPEAKRNKFFYDCLVKIKDRFVALFKLDDIIEIEQEIKQMRKELSLFPGQMRKFAQPMLSFINRNWQHLFLYKKYPDEKIENTNNGAEIIYSLFKPHYKIMKHLQRADSAQDHFETFTLRHNFRVFQRGKRAGKSPLQIESIEASGVDWTDLIWGNNSEELLEKIEASTLSNRVKNQPEKLEFLCDNYSSAKN